MPRQFLTVGLLSRKAPGQEQSDWEATMAERRCPPRMTRRAVPRTAAMVMAAAGVLAAQAARAAVIAPQASMAFGWNATIVPPITINEHQAHHCMALHEPL